MSKKLILVRHADTEEKSETGLDQDRLLTSDGREDAAEMGRLLAKLKAVPELIISSPAKRAVETVDSIRQGAGYAGEVLTSVDVHEYDMADGLDVDRLMDVVKDISDAYEDVLICGHRPGVERLAARFLWVRADDETEFPLQKAAVALIKLKADNWNEASSGSGELQLFLTAKHARRVMSPD